MPHVYEFCERSGTSGHRAILGDSLSMDRPLSDRVLWRWGVLIPVLVALAASLAAPNCRAVPYLQIDWQTGQVSLQGATSPDLVRGFRLGAIEFGGESYFARDLVNPDLYPAMNDALPATSGIGTADRSNGTFSTGNLDSTLATNVDVILPFGGYVIDSSSSNFAIATPYVLGDLFQPGNSLLDQDAADLDLSFTYTRTGTSQTRFGTIRVVGMPETPHVPTLSEWTGAQNHSWFEPNNWTGPVPDGRGDTARFTSTGLSPFSTILVHGRTTIGELALIAPSTQLSLVGLGSVRFEGASGQPGRIQVGPSGTELNIDIPMLWAPSEWVETNVSAASVLNLHQSLLPGSGSLRHGGPGTLRLLADNRTWGGQLEVTDGAVEPVHTFALRNGSVKLDGGALVLSSNLPFRALLTPQSGAGSIILNNVTNYQAGAQTSLDFSTISGGAELRLGARGISSLLPEFELLPNLVDHTLKFGGGDGELYVQGGIADRDGTPTHVLNDGPGRTELSGTNSYSGTTAVRDGMLIARGRSAVGQTSQFLVEESGILGAVGDFRDISVVANGGTVIGPGQLGPLQVSQVVALSNLSLQHLIHGSGGLDLYGADMRISHNNTYAGLTQVMGQYLYVQAPRALGDPSSPTIVKPLGSLVLDVAVDEPLELAGGTILFRDASALLPNPIVSHGGIVNIESMRQPLITPLVLDQGKTLVRAGQSTSPQTPLASGVTGTGALELEHVTVQGAPLSHHGDTRFFGATLSTPNTYTGTTTILDNTTRVLHSQAFGLSTEPVRVGVPGEAYGGISPWLSLEAPVARDFDVYEGKLAFEAQSLPYTGTVRTLGEFAIGTIAANGQFDGTIIADNHTTLLSQGVFRGLVQGTADIWVGGGAVLAHDNAYTGFTRVSGTARVTAPLGLGASAVGTVVFGSGDLILDASVDEPITVFPHGRVQVNQPIAKLPVFTTGPGAGTFLSTVVLNAPGSYAGFTDVLQGTLVIGAHTTLESMDVQGGLTVFQGQSLTVTKELEVQSGTIDVQGAVHTSRPIRKTTDDYVLLKNLSAFDGDMVIERGSVFAQGEHSLGSALGKTVVVGGSQATLLITRGFVVDDSIVLDNAHGRNGLGALAFSSSGNYNAPHTILRGTIDLGSVGSTIRGDSSPGAEIQSEIHGGSLIINGLSNDSYLRISGNGHTYSGETRLHKGLLSLLGEGQLASTSRIHIESNATLNLYSPYSDPDGRIADHIPLSMEGGTLRFWREGTGNNDPSEETLGVLNLVQGNSQIEVINSSSDSLVFEELLRSPGAVANVGIGINNRVQFEQPPTLRNGIIGSWITTELHDSHMRTKGFASYGSQGLTLLDQYTSDVNTSGPTDNVRWSTPAVLAADKSIYSLTLETEADLGGHLLTIESGGLIGAKLKNGRVTVGQDAGQELVVHRGEIEAVIEDNEIGPVDVTYLDGVLLRSPQTYTGVTRFLGGNTDTNVWENSIPLGGDVVVSDGRVRLFGPSGAHWHLGDVTLTDDGILDGIGQQISFNQFDLREGQLITGLAGSGHLRKSGPGLAQLHGYMGEFQGTITVEDGQLQTQQVPVPVTLTGGHLLLTNSRQTGPMTLAGGMLEFTGNLDAKIPGITPVLAASRIKSDRALDAVFEGNSPLTVVGEFWLMRSSPNFSGPVTVEATRLNMSTGALGTGPLTMAPGSRLNVQMDDSIRSFGPMTNAVILEGGDLALYSGYHPAAVQGPITVATTGRLTNEWETWPVVVESLVRLMDNSTLMVGHVGVVELAGSIHVEGLARIDTQVRHSASPSTLKPVPITGRIVAQSPNAVLDLLGSGDDFRASIEIPTGHALEMRRWGQPVPLMVTHPGQTVSGNGRFVNDATFALGGTLSPGASPGRLTIEGDVTWGPDGVYRWEWDSTNSQGAGIAWDLLDARQSLNVSATTDNPFVLQLVGFDPLGAGSGITEFDPYQNESWTIATADQLVGFDSRKFLIDTSWFATHAPLPANGIFSVAARDNTVLLVYQVPEPSGPVIIVCLTMLVASRRRW